MLQTLRNSANQQLEKSTLFLQSLQGFLTLKQNKEVKQEKQTNKQYSK